MKEWGKRRRQRKVRPGDGRAFVPMQWWHVLHRSAFHLELPVSNGAAGGSDEARPTVDYQVDVDHFSAEFEASLYREGRQVGVGASPAAFSVPGGVVEFAASLYGLKRMHYVPDDGEPTRMLEPDPRSMEGLRAEFDRRRPRASRAVGWAAVVILVVGLVVGGLQLAEVVSRWDVVPESWGVFISPVTLPGWANVTLTVAAVGAALERALTLRHHWLLDGGLGDFD